MKNPFPDMSRKRLYTIVGVGALVLLMIIRNLGSDDPDGEGGQSAPIAVQTQKVSLQRLEQTVTAAGKIQPVYETEISSTVSAQIMALRVEEGDEVAAGDTLVILDRLRYQAAYERTRSALRSAAARQRQVKAERDRGKQLFEKKLISLQDMEALEASYETALGAKDQAEASLQQAQDDYAKTVLMAPYGGVITKINKEAGEMALGSTFQADVLLIVSDLSSMEVIVDVDETDVVEIEILDLVEIEVDALPDTKFTGRVSRVAHAATIIGAGTQEQATNFEVVVTLDINPDSNRIDPRLRPGMSATATITTARVDNAVAVPIQALTARQPLPPEELADGEVGNGDEKDRTRRDRREGDGREGSTREAGASQRGPGGPGGRNGFGGPGGKKEEPVEVVFVIINDSTASGVGFVGRLFGKKAPEKVVQRQVELGISSDTHYQIVGGLKEGEEIVIGNYKAVSKELKDGSTITRKTREKGGKGRRRRQ